MYSTVVPALIACWGLQIRFCAKFAASGKALPMMMLTEYLDLGSLKSYLQVFAKKKCASGQKTRIGCGRKR